MNNLWPSVLSQ